MKKIFYYLMFTFIFFVGSNCVGALEECFYKSSDGKIDMVVRGTKAFLLKSYKNLGEDQDQDWYANWTVKYDDSDKYLEDCSKYNYINYFAWDGLNSVTLTNTEPTENERHYALTKYDFDSAALICEYQGGPSLDAMNITAKIRGDSVVFYIDGNVEVSDNGYLERDGFGVESFNVSFDDYEQLIKDAKNGECSKLEFSLTELESEEEPKYEGDKETQLLATITASNSDGTTTITPQGYSAITCNDTEIANILGIIKRLLNIVTILVPVLLVILIIVDVMKTITTAEVDQKKLFKSVSKRVIAAIVIFLVPHILNFILNLIPMGSTEWLNCWNIESSETLLDAENKVNEFAEYMKSSSPNKAVATRLYEEALDSFEQIPESGTKNILGIRLKTYKTELDKLED